MPTLRKRDGIWQYSFTVKGSRVRRSTGTTEKALATDIALNAEKRARRAAEYGPEAVLTFHEAIDLYMEAHDSRYLVPLLEHFKSTKIAQITAPMVREAAMKLYPRATAATRNRQAVTPCQAVINFAADSGLCQPLKVKRFPTSTKRRPAGSKEWLAAFQAEARSQGLDKIAALARFLFETGARISQGALLAHKDLNLAEGYAILRTRKTGRNGGEVSERIAWLTPTMVAEIGNLRHNDKYRVFGYGCRDTAQKQWRKVLDTGRVPYLTSHEGGRHGFGTEMIVRNGVDPVTTGERGGWKSTRLLMETYAHADAERAVIDKVFGTSKPSPSRQIRRAKGT